MRVFINPTYQGEDRADGGIRRVVEAQQQYLPEFGVQVTSSPDDADLIANHGAMLEERPGVPMVNHNHGLMWSAYNFGQWGDDVNKHVIDVMTRANAVTAPSRWVAHAISRGMLISPTVIYHGVDVDAWAHTEDSLGYVLWNKARADQVSDPRDMRDVAGLLPHIPFLSTFGQPMPNVHVMGAVPYGDMRPLVQRAGVYLATARETFGIGTIEALAAGVPIAGWRYGGQEEIVIEGQTGYLAEYGDYDGLAAAITRCLRDRAHLSPRCVADARARWSWKDKIAQYAQLYQDTLAAYTAPRPKVSVIITNYNLGRYLDAAVTSVRSQHMSDFECLIVDDGSTDGSWESAQNQAAIDPRFKAIQTPRNLGLAGARNFGWQHSRGRYVLFLDADDMLSPNALDTLSLALDWNTDIHIAFGHLDTVDEAGANQQHNPWPGAAFDWHSQIAHLNQLHYSSMMRREVLERGGGYRTRDWRAEDASFWTRVTSFGFRAAKVTDDATLIYRLRSDSKSRGEDGDGDWTAWFPWRLAGDPQTGLDAIRDKRQPNPLIVPFGAQGTPPAPLRAWPVHHHQHPLVSVIIPVGPGHAQYLIDALDSVQAQTFPFWEAIVVNDTGAEFEVSGAPYARVVATNGRRGAGAARNVGLDAARAPLVVFLDADDLLTPRALETMLRAFVQSDGKYVYSDWLTLEDETRIDGPMTARTVENYDQRKMLQGLRHAVTALVPREWVRGVSGFDETLKGFEDWDLYCKLAVVGACGVRTPHPLLIYRTASGLRTRTLLKPREHDDDAPAYTPLGEQTAEAIYSRYAAQRQGDERIMPCGSCGGQSQVVADAQSALDMLSLQTGGILSASAPVEGATVRMEFIGAQEGAMTFIGRVSGRVYRAGREMVSRFHDVDPRDVEHFVNLEVFRVVPPELLQAAARTDEPALVPAEPQQAAGRGRKR